MRKRLNDFVFSDNSGMSVLDIEKLMQLSDEEFLHVHVDDARQYMKNHGKNVECGECHHTVNAPEDLVRYSGTNLHGKCFISVYRREKEGLHKEPGAYFDRIFQLRMKEVFEM